VSSADWNHRDPCRFAIDPGTGKSAAAYASGGAIFDEPVPGEPERRRQALPPADGERGDQCHEQREEHEAEPDQPTRQSLGEDGLTCDVNHGEPPPGNDQAGR